MPGSGENSLSRERGLSSGFVSIIANHCFLSCETGENHLSLFCVWRGLKELIQAQAMLTTYGPVLSLPDRVGPTRWPVKPTVSL